MRLKNWTIQDDTISGYIYNSRRYPDGTYVRTSRIIAAAYDGEMLLVHTQNSDDSGHVPPLKMKGAAVRQHRTGLRA